MGTHISFPVVGTHIFSRGLHTYLCQRWAHTSFPEIDTPTCSKGGHKHLFQRWAHIYYPEMVTHIVSRGGHTYLFQSWAHTPFPEGGTHILSRGGHTNFSRYGYSFSFLDTLSLIMLLQKDLTCFILLPYLKISFSLLHFC